MGIKLACGDLKCPVHSETMRLKSKEMSSPESSDEVSRSFVNRRTYDFSLHSTVRTKTKEKMKLEYECPHGCCFTTISENIFYSEEDPGKTIKENFRY